MSVAPIDSSISTPPASAPPNIAATEIRRRAAWAPVAPAIGLSAAMQLVPLSPSFDSRSVVLSTREQDV